MVIRVGGTRLSRLVSSMHTMPRTSDRLLSLGFAVAAASLSFLNLVPVHAQSSQRPLGSENAGIIESENAPVRAVTVMVNKSRTFRIDRPFSAAVPGSPEILDVLPMTDRTLYLQGKKIGTTNVSMFDQNMRLIGILDVEVGADTGNVQDKIRATTGARGIRVTNSNGQVVLSGEVADAITADRAVSVAKSLNPEVVVVNAMSVASAQQVMLKVRFLEVERNAARALGVNWFAGNSSGNRGVTTGTLNGGGASVLSGTAVPVFQSVGALTGGLTQQPFGVALASLVNKGITVDLMISALETKGLIRRLAEPDLVALSGDTASFIAGGEFPVPIVQASSGTIPTISVDYKPFGVQLVFMPTVLKNGIINLRLAPTVSELDFTDAITISGFSVPSLTKREARTTIELRDGQSFAIAGMLQTQSQRDINQLPWIGSVPVLGALFGSKAYQQNETDLVVIVTPHLVAPAVPGQQIATPFDQKLPTNDPDFFLLGQMEVTKEYKDYVTRGGDIQGPYGHMVGPSTPASGYVVGPNPSPGKK
jgi:pilus assembly protein CpaC